MLETNCICRNNNTNLTVYIVITLLLALLQVVNICAPPVISTAAVTQTQFSKKTRKCYKQIVFAEIKVLIPF